MRIIAAIAIVVAAVTTGSVAGSNMGSHTTITAAGGNCPDTMVWDGISCVPR